MEHQPADGEVRQRDMQLDAIFRTEAADLYRFIERHVHQPTLAEDLTSAVFLKALHWLQHDRGTASVRGWLYATARSLIADYWREHAQLPLVPLEAADDVSVPVVGSAGSGQQKAQLAAVQARIQHLLDGLPERERDILTLRYLQGYSTAEVADRFGLSANHVRVLQFRALRRAAQLEAAERQVPMAAPILPYSDHAQRALDLANEEARTLRHSYVGTEHLLLGILREGSAPAVAALASQGITPENMRAGVTFILGRVAAAQPGSTQGPAPSAATPPPVPTAPHEAAQPASDPGFAPRTVQVLAMAGEEAKRLGKAAIGPQELLMALLREGQGVAAMLLQVSGVCWEPAGDTLQIRVIPADQGKPVTIPTDLQTALQQRPGEQRVFEAMSGIKQQGLIDRIERAQGEAARRQALEGVLDLLRRARENYQRGQPQGH